MQKTTIQVPDVLPEEQQVSWEILQFVSINIFFSNPVFASMNEIKISPWSHSLFSSALEKVTKLSNP